jgi:hypothetical protein
MRDLISAPVQEYPWFGATLAFIAMIPPDETAHLLEYRALALEASIASGDTVLRRMAELGLPRVFGVEAEYGLAMQRAELVWVRSVMDEIRSGKLEWPKKVLEHTEQRSREQED